MQLSFYIFQILDIRIFSNELNTFAFVEFENDAMAENAVRALGDTTIGLSRAKVGGITTMSLRRNGIICFTL